MKSEQEIKELVLTKGRYSSGENERIYEKWFKKGLRRSFLEAVKRYNLSERSVCDVGCAYGTNLLYCGLNSYGLEIEEYEVKFARALGLNVYQKDIFSDISMLPKVDVVWNADVLEHVDSPHIFLRKLQMLLKDNGLLILKVPTIPYLKINFFHVLKQYQSGHLHSDHINAFTRKTLKFFCERAGFETLLVGGFLPRPFSFFESIPFFQNNIGQAVYVGRKIKNWEYGEHATRRASNNEKGFVFMGQKFNDDNKE